MGPWNPTLPQRARKDGAPAKAARDGPSATPTPAIINGRREPDFRHNLGQVEVYCDRSTPRTRASAPLDVSMTLGRFVTVFCVSLCLISFASAAAWAQGVQPYPNACTARLVPAKTAMAPPP